MTTSDRQIRCGPRCSATYRRGAVRTLTASPGRLFSFARWTGDCVGTAPICVVALDRPTRVRADFVRKPGVVSLTVGGPGTVVSSPRGITCGDGRGNCGNVFGQGTTVMLTATPAADGRLAAWGRACAENALRVCTVQVGETTATVTAAFAHATPGPGPQTLTVRTSGASVRSEPPGIDCGSTCRASFPSGTLVTLSGADRWGGACAGSAPVCMLVVDAPTEVLAAAFYDPPPVPRAPLDLTVSGPGLVRGGRGHIACGRAGRAFPLCDTVLQPTPTDRRTVELRVIPGRHSRFAGWRGACAGKRTRCRLTYRRDATYVVTALFRDSAR